MRPTVLVTGADKKNSQNKKNTTIEKNKFNATIAVAIKLFRLILGRPPGGPQELLLLLPPPPRELVAV